MSDITRIETGRRMSQVTIHNQVAYLAGQIPDDGHSDITVQTQQVLAKIDRLLAEAGSDRGRLLSAQVFLADIGDFAGMNQVWEAWVPEGTAPSRATVQAHLAGPGFKVEIVVLAAVA